MNIHDVSLNDWVSLSVALIGFLTAWASRSNRLPARARKWLKRIGRKKIADAIERAGAIAELTPDQRRQQAVIYLQKLCLKEFGFPVPSSIANLLIEFIYQGLKRAGKLVA